MTVEEIRQLRSRLRVLAASTSHGEEVLGSPGGGTLSPGRLRLALTGSSRVDHDVTHLHEVFHKALNESTAWGSALQISHLYRPWRTAGRDLLDAARLVHEAYATYMSVLLASGTHPGARDVLRGAAVYEELFDAMDDLLVDVEGDHRRFFVATAIARVCMQAPLLKVMQEAFPEPPSIAEIRAADRPDDRFAWLLEKGLADLGEAASAADEELLRVTGMTLDEFDERTIRDNESLDAEWSRWERVVFEYVGGVLRAGGATILEPDGHLSAANDLIEQLKPLGVRLPRVIAQGRTDLDESSAALAHTRYLLRDKPWSGVMGLVGPSIDIEGVVALSDATTRVGGIPELVVHVRLADSLLRTESWDPRSSERLRARQGRAVVTARAIVNESEDSDDLLVHHAVFEEAADVANLLEAWGDRGPVAVVVAVSSYLDEGFAQAWMPTVAARAPVVILLDLPITALTGPASLFPPGQPLFVRQLGIGSPVYRGLQWHVDGHDHIGLFIGDGLGVELVRDQMLALDSQATAREADWTAWDPVVTTVIRNLLATESSLGFFVEE